MSITSFVRRLVKVAAESGSVSAAQSMATKVGEAVGGRMADRIKPPPAPDVDAIAKRVVELMREEKR